MSLAMIEDIGSTCFNPVQILTQKQMEPPTVSGKSNYGALLGNGEV